MTIRNSTKGKALTGGAAAIRYLLVIVTLIEDVWERVEKK